jgi:hypothetical protein
LHGEINSKIETGKIPEISSWAWLNFMHVRPLVKSFVTLFLFFPMAIGVNDKKDENNQATNNQNNDDRLVMPQISHKI